MDFGAFWQRYPRKVAKADAEKAWKRLNMIDAQAASDGLDEHLTYWRGQDKQFIPYAGTWIRGRRWEDELETPAAQLSDHEFFRIHGYRRQA